MANRSIYNAFKTMWQHVTNALNSKSDINHKHDDIYDAKGSAITAETNAKVYTNNATAKVKNDLLNGAGDAYDTLHELGDLIDENKDAIDALREVATNKANAADLTNHANNKSNPHNITASQLGLSTETWSFTLANGTVVTKEVVIK